VCRGIMQRRRNGATPCPPARIALLLVQASRASAVVSGPTQARLLPSVLYPSSQPASQQPARLSVCLRRCISVFLSPLCWPAHRHTHTLSLFLPQPLQRVVNRRLLQPSRRGSNRGGEVEAGVTGVLIGRTLNAIPGYVCSCRLCQMGQMQRWREALLRRARPRLLRQRSTGQR